MLSLIDSDLRNKNRDLKIFLESERKLKFHPRYTFFINNYLFEKRLRRYRSFSFLLFLFFFWKNVISSEEMELSVILDTISSIPPLSRHGSWRVSETPRSTSISEIILSKDGKWKMEQSRRSSVCFYSFLQICLK